MDVDTIKLVLAILYVSMLVAGGLVWYRLKCTPNGDLYRKLRVNGGYMVEGADQADTEVRPHARVHLRRARYP